MNLEAELFLVEPPDENSQAETFITASENLHSRP